MRNRYEGIRRFFVVVGWLYFIFMAFMLLHPRPPVDYVPQYMFSVAHFLAFAALGALVGFARRKTSSYYWFGILFVWCSGSEYLQRYTGRFFEMRDIIQNTLGVGFGLPLAWLIRRYLFGDKGEVVSDSTAKLDSEAEDAAS